MRSSNPFSQQTLHTAVRGLGVRNVGGGYRRAGGGHTQDEPPFRGLRPTSGWTAPLSPEPRQQRLTGGFRRMKRSC